jgi:hypothetical protein
MWQGDECWILGGGPSLVEQFDIPQDLVQAVKAKQEPLSAYSPYLSSIHNKHIIGVNTAFMLGDWVEMTFFGDKGFFLKYRHQLAEYTGLKLSSASNIEQSRFSGDGIKYLRKDPSRPTGISLNRATVSWNKNSGAAAISVAAHTGATRIILVGFDMKNSADHSQHWHGEYGRQGHPPKDGKRLPFHRHLLGWDNIAKHARKRGIEILNASPDSAITQLKKVRVKDLL